MQMSYRIRGVPISIRLLLFLSLAAGGVLLQTLVPGAAIPGTLLVFAATIPLWAKSYDNRPKDLGFEEWKPVSFREVERIRVNLAESKAKKIGFLFRPGAVGFLIVTTIIFGFFGLGLALGEGRPGLFLFAVDWFLLGLPLFGGGKIKLFRPPELAMKLDAFTPIIDQQGDDAFVITPYIRFDRDKEEQEIPEDVRFMVELRRSPDDFVGAQFQVAINKGPNGAVPYLYAVYLCRGRGKSFEALSRASHGKYIVEPGGDGEYGTVVIRQETSGSGYHTRPAECERLFRLVTSTMISAFSI